MKKILILGGGFGGVRCALDLEKRFRREVESNEIEIKVIDKNYYHLFTPSLYEVASAYGLKKDPFSIQLKKTVGIPYADIFENKKINFLEGEIAEVNFAIKKVMTKGGHVLDYDFLVLGLGSETYDYHVPGAIEYANQFKTLDDAIFINEKLEELSEQFISGTRTEPFSFLICGAGFTGVELAAELGCCSGAIKQRCKLEGRCSNITIFEAGPRILSMVTDNERDKIKKRLTKLGVMIMENSPIEEVGSNFIKLKSGQRLKGDLIIWTAGTKPNRINTSINGLNLSQSGKINVEDDLRMKGSKDIFAIGDNTEMIDPKTQRPIPGLAYIAVDQGKIVAKNIYNLIKNKKIKSYKPSYLVYVLPVGGKYATGHLFANLSIFGIFGWLLRAAVDIRYFLSILSPVKAFRLYIEEIKIFLKND